MKPAVVVGTNGKVYAPIQELRGSPRTSRVVKELETEVGGEVFVGVAVDGLCLRRLLAGLDDRAAEIVAVAAGRQRRRRSARRS